MCRKRASLECSARENQCQQQRTAQRQRRTGQNSTLLEASHAFTSAIKDGPDYVCVCCNRLMYRKTVQEFQKYKYDKAPSQFVVPESISIQLDKKWICKTCHNALNRGLLPAQAKANNLDLDDIPVELSDLNPLEVRPVSLRIKLLTQSRILSGVDELILLTWSFSVCIAGVITDYRGWYVLSEVGGAIMCVRMFLQVFHKLLPQTSLTRLDTEAEKRQLPSLGMSLTKKPLSWAREFKVTSSI